ncbi:cation-translocating P-type ATPase [Spiroplasma citri]|uniref:cation-translocating P-type ATPase n=1 Tax=Spiroplasma citri TaxID=2133 RepID=UPI001EF94171|nr:cation-translocating P-type ATPase [Spiroplasma citri]
MLAEQTNMAFMSNFITNGRAVEIIVANAVDSEIGKIAAAIVKTKQEKTPLQLRLTKLTKVVSIFAILLAIFVFVFFLLTDENSWPINLMTSVTIAIAVIPEFLIVIVSVILSLSVKRMTKVNVIVKKLDAVETLGSVNVICSDKTGTLTQNKMTVKEIIFNNEIFKENDFNYQQNNKAAFHFINCLTLCNDAINQKNERIGDPTEISLIDFTRRFTISEIEYREKYLRVLEVPFDSDRKLMSTVNHVDKQEFVYTKVALNQLLMQCNWIYLNNEIVPLTEAMKEEIQEEALDLSSQALRVLAFAFKKKDQQEIETNLIFLGAVGMIDPPRPEAVEAVRKAHEVGNRVIMIMITGDHKATVLAIAKELRLAVSEANVLSGHQTDKMDNHKLQEKLRDVSVFARVNPDHKTRIVECLQSMNYVVSMAGDGVNDAPSLSKADIGVAMGITGTDVSKEAANIILQDDNFLTIIRGVEEGRNVYHKIKRVIAFVCIAQLANVLAFIIISVITKIKPFDSVNILWFNLVIETLMSISIGLGNNDNGLMLEKPRSKKETFFTNSLVTILYLAFVTAASVIGTFFIGKNIFHNIEDAKIATILVMACSPVIFAFAIQLPNYRIKTQYNVAPTNYYLLGASLIALILNFLMVYTPGLNLIFLTTTKEYKFDTSPLLSWQMTVVSLGMMVLPLLMLLGYDAFRKLIRR